MSSAVRSAFAGGGGLLLDGSRRRLFSSVAEALPGINSAESSFEQLRQQKAVYVDKTAFIPELVALPQHKFIARPRRFGKSLLLDTVRCAFMKPGERKAELFKGLAITQSEAGQRILDMHLPVIHLDLSRVDGTDGKQALKDALRSRLTVVGDKHKVHFEANNDLAVHLNKLIVAVRRRHRDEYEDMFCTMTEAEIDRLTRVVFLMDEYDAPITQVLKYNERGIADERLLPNMEVLSGLLSECKALSPSAFHCSLYTGVSRFTGKGLFSAWNNVKDVSSWEKFGTLFGYTQREMEENFGPHLRALRDRWPEVDKRLRVKYNGYSFGVSGDGNLTESVYNPFCINNVLLDQELGSYFTDLTPGWLFSLLEQHHVAEVASQLSRWHHKAELFGKQDAEQLKGRSTSAVSLLLQTGYLTLTEGRANDLCETEVRLGYPNDEIRQQFASNYLSGLLSQTVEYTEITKLYNAFKAGEPASFMRVFDGLLVSISYDTSSREPYESFFHGCLQTCLLLLPSTCRASDQVSGRHGRLDSMIEEERGGVIHRWVIEVKASNAVREKLRAEAAGALEQIRKNKYDKGQMASANTKTTQIGVVIGRDERRVAAVAWRRAGEEEDHVELWEGR